MNRRVLQLGRRSQLSFSTLIDESLRRELRKTVADPNNRKLVYQLLNKANEESWDLSKELDASLDPFKCVEKDMKQLNHGIAELVANKHPLLSVMAKYYFQIPGKRFRPTVVLLMGRATGGDDTTAARHIQLAEIVEMIHTASLAHDDVLDEAEERRSQPSINKFGNKFAILVGDFLLARASVSLANLKDHTVTGLLSNMIAELVEGEFVQMRPQAELTMELYLRKTYLKTASMLRSAARASALLSDARNEAFVEAASEYGESLGMAFQIVDDILDFQDGTGKRKNADLSAGIVTAPLLYAAEARPELRSLFARGMKEPNDSTRALELLESTDGMQKARLLAEKYCEQARMALLKLPASHSRDVLKNLVDRVVERKA